MAHSITNRLRGLAAALVAVLAALALVPGTAMADSIGGNTVNISNLEPGDQVYLYQVVKTDRDTTTNVATNDFVADFGVTFDDWTKANTPADPDTSAEVEGYASAIATYVNGHKSQWGGQGYTMYGPQTAGKNNQATFTDVDAGQYLVVVESEADATRVYQNTIVSVTPTTNGSDYVPTTNAKADLKFTDMDEDADGSVVDKKINGADSVDNVDSNDTVRFTITAPIPHYVLNFNTRQFTLNDVMDDGFVYVDDSLQVMVGSTPLSEGMEYKVLKENDGSYSISLTSVALQVYAGQTLTVSYDATLAQDENAPTYRAAENNKVSLTFSKNSNDDTTGTANDGVYMVVYGLKFNKVSSVDGKALKGAEFEVRDLGGNTVAKGTSDENGLVSIEGALAAGEQYVLVETKAPAGFQTIDQLPFSIDSIDYQFSHCGYQYEINDGTIEDEPSNFFTQLPTTGGMGTVAFTAAGVVIIAGAAAFIVRSRKNNN